MIGLKQLPSQTEGRIRLFHIVVVVLSLMLTITAWQFSKYQVEKQTQLAFEASRDQALGLIVDRMNKYEDALWAGVAAVESHGDDMSYQEWKTFARTLRIDERYPGINGIGLINAHNEATLIAYLARQQQFRPDFRVFPTHSQPIKMPITLIEPTATNAAAVGLDVAHERNRRTAALASRDTGKARITGPITLVQDADSTAGFLFYAPLYRGERPTTITARQDAFLGAVYAPFVVHRLMDGLLSEDLRNIRFSIRDEDTLIYDEHQPQDPTYDPKPLFVETVGLDLYGRTWTVDIRTNSAFRKNNTLSKPMFILIAGLFIEALIVALLFQMARANTRAVAYADEVTLALRRESLKLADTNVALSNKNHELEQFAYVASHDLKTPLRGIGTLTEMIEEDLEGYFAAADANPDVAANLTRIQDRVHRMNDLTRGILDYVQIGRKPAEDAPVMLDALIASLAFDFGLHQADQLQLTGDVYQVDTDTVHFRQVIENLVGNAIKYHHDVDHLLVKVNVTATGGRYSVSVTDNGPGIAPEFQEKVFQVFQTLRSGGDAESTGIGLSIVKKAVERHGGKITLRSSLGHGATFAFDWPMNDGIIAADRICAA
tara:strand:+ start:63219 stop:65030 length:1812 start_codon:yes stop_codon:yes gene_type:complete